VKGKLDASDDRSQQYIPITDFFNTHACSQQLAHCAPDFWPIYSTAIPRREL
jgi:hypothetical protein